MQQMRHPVRGAVALAFLLAVIGCSGNPAVYPVKGKVMWEGKPMAGGGSISFVPLGNQPGKAAGGFIAEDGTYTLTTHREGDGSMPGEFRVVINQVTETEPQRTEDGKAVAKGKSLPAADRIPTIFSDTYQSPVKVKVEAKSPNEINIDLKKTDVPAPTRPPGA
jgi:hypothetical protein